MFNMGPSNNVMLRYGMSQQPQPQNNQQSNIGINGTNSWIGPRNVNSNISNIGVNGTDSWIGPRNVNNQNHIQLGIDPLGPANPMPAMTTSPINQPPMGGMMQPQVQPPLNIPPPSNMQQSGIGMGGPTNMGTMGNRVNMPPVGNQSMNNQMNPLMTRYNQMMNIR